MSPISKHDKRVKQLVNQLKKDGWKVQADLPGSDKPDPIGMKNKIPDIRATKKGAERIIEVETEKSESTDKAQHSTFRRHSAHKPRSTFNIDVVDDK